MRYSAGDRPRPFDGWSQESGDSSQEPGSGLRGSARPSRRSVDPVRPSRGGGPSGRGAVGDPVGWPEGPFVDGAPGCAFGGGTLARPVGTAARPVGRRGRCRW
ncbi:hypothetical protein ACFP2T_30885 [Plantactinospora solaniradicis]|uniref:Uncharacterized protein n=1 Tax=Plantactinospora solaniradicis TaxID=1723736 RepID=A0ABW1KG71_9ACTN